MIRNLWRKISGFSELPEAEPDCLAVQNKESSSPERTMLCSDSTVDERSRRPELFALRNIYRQEAERGGTGAGAKAYCGRLKNVDETIVQSSMGCGDPLVFAAPAQGEMVLDLGCGMGLDSMLAADAVGTGGHVAGVDYIPELLVRAADNVSKRQGKMNTGNRSQNLSFISADAGSLPFGDDSFDLVISNAVLHLLPDRLMALKEIHRVLKPAGRLVFSDLAVTNEPDSVLRDEFVKTGGRFVFGAFSSRIALAADLFESGFLEIDFASQYRTPYKEKMDQHFEAWPVSAEKKAELIEAVSDNTLWVVTVKAEKSGQSWQQLQLPCACGMWVNVKVAPSVNVTARPHFYRLLKNVDLNSAACSGCGHEIESPVQYIYHDMEKRQLFVVFPGGLREEKGDISEGFENFIRSRKESGEINADYVTDAIFGTAELRCRV